MTHGHELMGRGDGKYAYSIPLFLDVAIGSPCAGRAGYDKSLSPRNIVQLSYGTNSIPEAVLSYLWAGWKIWIPPCWLSPNPERRRSRFFAENNTHPTSGTAGAVENGNKENCLRQT